MLQHENEERKLVKQEDLLQLYKLRSLENESCKNLGILIIKILHLSTDSSYFMDILSIVLFAILASLFFVKSVKNIELSILILIVSISLNITFPITIAGQQINTQRIAMIMVLFSLITHLIHYKKSIGKFHKIQIYINLYFLGVVVLLFAHMLINNDEDSFSTVLVSIFNLILFNCIIIVVKNASYQRLRNLFHYLIPISILIITSYFAFNYRNQLLMMGVANDFSTSFRIRSDDERNIINAWSASMALLLPFCGIAWENIRSSNLSKIFSLFAGGGLFIVIILSFSRASLLAITFTFIFGIILIIIRKRSTVTVGTKIIFTILTLFAFWVYVIFLAENELIRQLINLWDLRVSGLSDGQDASLFSRLSAYRYVFEDFVVKPIIGFGANYDNRGGVPTENSFLQVLLLGGIIGLSLFCIPLVSIGRLIFAKLTSKNNVYSLSEQCLYFMYIFLMLTNDFMFFSMGTVVLALLVSNNDDRIFQVKNRPFLYNHL